MVKKKILELSNGIPSHDTFARVLSLIDPKEFELVFLKWVKDSRVNIKNDVLCIDGKISKGTVFHKKGSSKDMLNTVHVFSTLGQLVLGQFASAGGNSESTSVIELLDFFDISGCTIVGDAGIGLKSVANKIHEKNGKYIFPVKNNGKNLKDFIEREFINIAEKNSTSQKVEIASSADKTHGRSEERHISVKRVKDIESLPEFMLNSDHKHIKTIGKIVYISTEKDKRPHIQKMDINGKMEFLPVTGKKRKKQVRYFISNFESSADTHLDKLRKQWRIENQLHWVLDVGFGEDKNKTRNKLIAENLATARKIAFNLLKQDDGYKIGMKAKLKLAGWDTSYLEKILFHQVLG